MSKLSNGIIKFKNIRRTIRWGGYKVVSSEELNSHLKDFKRRNLKKNS